MIRLAVFSLVAGLLFGFAPAGSAFGDTASSTFSVRLFGAPVGRMVIAANTGAGAYTAKGEFRTTGLVGLLARVRFTMSARGQGAPLAMRSQSYVEDLDTGFRTSAASIRFGSNDRRIDPLTALVAALVDRPVDKGCRYDGETFDGIRSMRIRIREGASSADELVCSGQLRRLAGYTAEEMAEATTFPFSIAFSRTGERLVVRRADVVTIHGNVALVRR